MALNSNETKGEHVKGLSTRNRYGLIVDTSPAVCVTSKASCEPGSKNLTIRQVTPRDQLRVKFSSENIVSDGTTWPIQSATTEQASEQVVTPTCSSSALEWILCVYEKWMNKPRFKEDALNVAALTTNDPDSSQLSTEGPNNLSAQAHDAELQILEPGQQASSGKGKRRALPSSEPEEHTDLVIDISAPPHTVLRPLQRAGPALVGCSAFEGGYNN